MDSMVNSNLPEEEEKIQRQQNAPTESLLSKRKQPETKLAEDD